MFDVTEPSAEEPKKSDVVSTNRGEKGVPTLSPRAATVATQILEALAENLDQSEITAVVEEQIIAKTHHGPLPAPEDLADYERVMPGLAERIVARSETEQRYRHEMSRELMDREFTLRTRGQIFGLISLVMMLAVVGVMAWLGHGAEAAALGTATIVGVVSVFVIGQRPEANGKNGKSEE